MANKTRVALVTGAASGIGKATAERLLSVGFRVIATDLATTRPDSTLAGLHYAPLDVTSEAAWKSILTSLEAEYGSLDVLVNNAGIVLPGALTDISLRDFQRVNRVNVESVFLGMKYAIPRMRAAGGGCIVNMSSVAGLKGIANMGAYSATKWAVRSLTKTAALECASQNIRINAVLPGLIDTAINDQLTNATGAARTSAVTEWAKRIVPIGVPGSAADVAAAVAWLASEDARYVTGAELVIDGGLGLT